MSFMFKRRKKPARYPLATNSGSKSHPLLVEAIPSYDGTEKYLLIDRVRISRNDVPAIRELLNWVETANAQQND